jgi:hypothetical protein
MNMKLSEKSFGDDYWSNEVGSRSGEARLRRGLKKRLSKVRRSEAKEIIRRNDHGKIN